MIPQNDVQADYFAESFYGGYTIELFAGSTLIASQTNAVTSTAGTFTDATFFVDSDTLDSSLPGQSLSLVFTQTSTSQGAATDFDNVRFTAAAVPEPGAWGLFGLGALVLGGAMKRRK